MEDFPSNIFSLIVFCCIFAIDLTAVDSANLTVKIRVFLALVLFTYQPDFFHWRNQNFATFEARHRYCGGKEDRKLFRMAWAEALFLEFVMERQATPQFTIAQHSEACHLWHGLALDMKIRLEPSEFHFNSTVFLLLSKLLDRSVGT